MKRKNEIDLAELSYKKEIEQAIDYNDKHRLYFGAGRTALSQGVQVEEIE